MSLKTFYIHVALLMLIVSLPYWQTCAFVGIFWIARGLWIGRKEVIKWLKEPLK